VKILIVEDDPIASATLDGALRALGHEVTMTADGHAGWAVAQADNHRVIISDWRMPGLDGLELCRRIRQRAGNYIYFILLSSQTTTSENLDQATQAGVDDFLTKPAKLPELKARLHVAERILNYATQVQQLESFIPICSYCKNVRDDKNYWNQIENYINARTGSSFSHGICPACYDKVMVPQMRQLGLEPPPYGQTRAGQP
jgi:phosphoserine phosphatase RsbU/P